MTRTEYLRNQTITAANKCCRTPVPDHSVADEPLSIAERKALALKWQFDEMPVFIGPKELIVGTRTFLKANEGNEDGHDVFAYHLFVDTKYICDKDVEMFGCNQSYYNKTHITPDFSIILNKGIDGIISSAEKRLMDDSLNSVSKEFLSSVLIAYNGLKDFILRYSDYALLLSEKTNGIEKDELLEISRICRKISAEKPTSFREAVQLLWFSHLGTIIESKQFVNYGRLDVILYPFLNDTPREEAQQVIDCLLMKMYDQYDVKDSYLGKYSAQLVVTLGGVLPNGENAVNDVTMMFLDAIDRIRLPEPEFNLRINSKNPHQFLDRAAELTISGCNFVSYYNDDLFIESLVKAGVPVEYARDYGFDLCQDINIPGYGDFWLAGQTSLIHVLMDLLKKECVFDSFEDLITAFKSRISESVDSNISSFNTAQHHVLLYGDGNLDEYFDGIRNHGKPVDRGGNSPMSPLPYLSGLYHGCIENAKDVIYEPYPVKDKGYIFGTATETVNSLAAIKKAVFDDQRLSLSEVITECEEDFNDEYGKQVREILWNCPKWGNDDDYVDSIAKDILEYCLTLCKHYKTSEGGQILGGIHQPHPVPTGAGIMATPEGRHAHAPATVTLTPENGTMKNGPTAALKSAAKIDPMLVQWNFCVMVNYFSSVFRGNNGKEIFKKLIKGYFAAGGLQHQPNVVDVDDLKKAQLEPEKYKDLIVRLWGVSAHFVDLPKQLQDEMIARFCY